MGSLGDNLGQASSSFHNYTCITKALIQQDSGPLESRRAWEKKETFDWFVGSVS